MYKVSLSKRVRYAPTFLRIENISLSFKAFDIYLIVFLLKYLSLCDIFQISHFKMKTIVNIPNILGIFVNKPSKVPTPNANSE